MCKRFARKLGSCQNEIHASSEMSFSGDHLAANLLTHHRSLGLPQDIDINTSLLVRFNFMGFVNTLSLSMLCKALAGVLLIFSANGELA